MDKHDTTEYGDQELSLIVMNDEFHYNNTRRIPLRKRLREYCDEYFTYTEEQFEELCDDLDVV